MLKLDIVGEDQGAATKLQRNLWGFRRDAAVVMRGCGHLVIQITKWLHLDDAPMNLSTSS